MGKETSARIQTSMVSRAEKDILVWLAVRQPIWVTSDFLTYLGLLGAAICALGFILSTINLNFLWLSSFGLLVNWYGDSLDGTLARVRNLQRPIYGFFLDHSLDAITICFMCIGAGLSPIFRLDVAFFVLTGYLVLSIYTYICTILKDEFRLTYNSFGPTEFRIAIILLNTVVMYSPLLEYSYHIGEQVFGFFDLIALGIGVFLFLSYLMQFLKDRKIFAKKDPFKPYIKD